MSAFKDHFSGHAACYREARPSYPAALFAWLAEQTWGHGHAWDCATGNGQAAVALARHFDAVTATDASAEQIAQAEASDRVRYRTARAEHGGLADASLDLVTVAQAAHWFDWPAFVTETRRVLRPGGVLAVWCYGLARVTPEVDAVIDHLYHHIVGAWWPPERRLVEEDYAGLAMHGQAITPPHLAMQATWSLSALTDYLSTWSAIRRHDEDTGRDALAAVTTRLQQAWGDPQQTRTLTWPLTIKASRY